MVSHKSDYDDINMTILLFHCYTDSPQLPNSYGFVHWFTTYYECMKIMAKVR